MADSDKPKTEGRPESPTTARELDFDDDEPASHPQTPAKDVSHATAKAESMQSPSEATSGGAGVGTRTAGDESTTDTTPTTTTAAPPAQPPRAMSPREQAEMTLREAFPSIEGSVVRAVLAASGGQVEPAFNALLGMTDPSAQVDTAPAPAPPPATAPRPAPPPSAMKPSTRAQQQGGGVGAEGGPARNQLEADELYARQLAEHYQRQDARAMAREQGGYARTGPGRGQQQQQGGHYGEEERERNFIDDDLPEIGENIRKGFLETQQKFNGWFNTLKKRIDGEDEEEPPQLPTRRGQASSARRSDDFERYDADPEEFGNDFSRLQLRDGEAGPPKQPPRRANPDLFKPTPAAPQEGRRVSFQSGPPEEIGGANDQSKQKSKWQPLSAVEPSPVEEHDPFSLGDSDDDESKKKDGKDTKDSKADGSDLLSKATAEAMAGEIGDDPGPKLELKDNTESEGKGK